MKERRKKMRKKKKIINLYVVGTYLYLYNVYNDTIRKFDLINDDHTTYNLYIKHYALGNFKIEISCQDYRFLKLARWL